MSEETARQTAIRMREHLQKNNKPGAIIIFHGGEPLLGGLDHLKSLVRIIDEELISQGIRISFGMQSNATLLTGEIADFLLERRITFGTSLDGLPEWSDRVRVDHLGRPSSGAVETSLRLLMAPKYKTIFSGILCVINIDSSPEETCDYLMQFSPSMIDFLYPLNNHDNLPYGKTVDPSATPYGDWLIRAFDRWWERGAPCDVRIFSSIMQLCCGLSSSVESLGVGKVDLIVVETNGDIEGLDSLKSTFEGATELFHNIYEHTFDQVARHPLVRLRQLGMGQLNSVCQTCPVVKVCGGGYIPHRYSAARKFDNPSVYCRDLEKLIRHIHATLHQTIESAIQTVAVGESA
jgi:uncharacterized protein